MITILFYSISVFLILTLYYFYKPKQQQQHRHQHNLDECNQQMILNQFNDNLDQSDLISISSNISGSLITTTNNDQQNALVYNSNDDLTVINPRYNRNAIENLYTYTQYKEAKREAVNKKRCLMSNNDNDAIVVEFFNKYFNKKVLSKYLGINDTNRNGGNKNFSIIHRDSLNK